MDLSTKDLRYLLYLSDEEITDHILIRTLITYKQNLFRVKNAYLNHNRLTIIPDNIQYLVNLTYLNLTNNQLVSISPEIKHLVNLDTLLLNNNQLTSLPSEINHLQLERMKINNNPINTLSNLNLYILYVIAC